MSQAQEQKYEMSEYQKFIHQSRYARWDDKKNRRETWEETVDRYCSFWAEKYPDVFPKKKVYDGIQQMKFMPSMRALMTAGPALDRDNMAGYNCSFIIVDNLRAFDEIAYILMCGTGVGFSVERQHISNLPVIPDEFHNTDTVITVADSKIGWASAYRELISLLSAGLVPKWDVSRVRAAGERLKTFGGRASGPQPLIDLFRFTIDVFKKAAGRKLNSLECHDIVCKIADIVVVGGVRRSALISLSNLSDERLRNAKTGQWWETEGQRQLANNSAAYSEKPDIGIFMQEWLALYESKSGERGIFNRVSANKKAQENGRREWVDQVFGTNPCGEIILRSCGLCNLTEVVVRSTDTLQDLIDKVELATITGTFQSTLTNFRYVRKVWQKNAEEERLLGVSMTGIMDHPILSGKNSNTAYAEMTGDPTWKDFLGDYKLDKLEDVLDFLKKHAIKVNKKWADKLGIQQSVAITTVKPSGTVSQLVVCASGIHTQYAQYYIRTVRNDRKDPLTKLMIECGIPYEPAIGKEESVVVFSFPLSAPENSVYRLDINAIEQLEHYLIYQKHWCEHNPSITVYVKEHEWFDVGAWVYKNFDLIGGVSFLPFSDHVYQQAPYQEIDKATYDKLVAELPKVDWSRLPEFEKYDETTGSQELACVSGVCELP